MEIKGLRENEWENGEILETLYRIKNGVTAMYCVGTAGKDNDGTLSKYDCGEALAYMLEKVVEDIDTVIIMLNNKRNLKKEG